MKTPTRFLLRVPCAVMIAAAGCSKRPSIQPQAEAPNTTSTIPALSQTRAKVEPCSLLTSEEIQSVQGEPVKDTHSSSHTGRGFIVSQCFFALPTPANSISVALTEKSDGNDARNPKEFWRETFHRKGDSGEADKKDKRGEEEEEEKSPPERIADLGDEAFWMGAHISTALYVLRGDCFIRISVGGAVGDTKSKLEKSKKLAQFALKRL